MRELLVMSEAKEREKWQHTSQMLAMFCNAFGGKATPADFDPFSAASRSRPLDRQQARDLLRIINEKTEQARAKEAAESKT